MTTFYAGAATIELHRTETANYISNLESGAPLLWVVLRPTGAEPPYDVMTVTADPAEGEAFTEAGNDLVETVPMPDEHRRGAGGVHRRASRGAAVLQASARPQRAACRPQRRAGGRAMSDSENFVARWSRLKRDTAKEKTEADAARSRPAAGRRRRSRRRAGSARARRRQRASRPKPPSIRRRCRRSSPSRPTATSAPFCNPACRRSLTKAALRRVWTTDPAIRDFIGIAENQWDFTDPTAMPGFGPLEATDDVGELVAQAMGKLGQVSEPSVEAAVPPEQGVASTSSAVGNPPQKRPLQVAGMPAGKRAAVERRAVCSQ